MGKDVEGLTSNVRDEDIIRHHVPESPGVSLGTAQARKDRRSLTRLLERALLLVSGGVFVEHIYNLFFSANTVLVKKASEVGQPRGAGSNLCECHLPHWTAAAQEEDYSLNALFLVSFGFCS